MLSKTRRLGKRCLQQNALIVEIKNFTHPCIQGNYKANYIFLDEVANGSVLGKQLKTKPNLTATIWINPPAKMTGRSHEPWVHEGP